MKIFRWFSENVLFAITLFLLAFIPLYPKLPVIGVNHTWVYIRIEDFLVSIALIVWFVYTLRKKATFKTPLTIPIVIFWIIGGVSTLFAVLFIFPHIANVFPNVAFFNYLRQIEYLSVFFIGFSAIKNKSAIPPLITVLVITLLCVVGYGIGQRLYGFPAFLTMNEEFAKGIPLRLSSLARIPSTFAGHYDLAAYLVFMIPLLGSMVFGFKNILFKLLLIGAVIAGVVLLLMTASRVSFVDYLLGITFMLVLQKKKLFIIPVLIASMLLLHSFSGITDRFNNTIAPVDLVVDARTGKAIGIANPTDNTRKTSNKKKAPIVVQTQQSTGENLPPGSIYVGLPPQASDQTVTQVTYKRLLIKAGTESAEVTNIQGDFVVKKVLAYDVSFTTRFQGEWPRAIDAFKRNMLLGSGYSSISLATDNNYLRMLGETGLLGLASFLLFFLIFGIYVQRVLPFVDSPWAKSFIIGSTAGLFGLALNGILIDVFEASKVAFVFWFIIGITFRLLTIYQKDKIHVVSSVKKILLSQPAIIIYLFVIAFLVFSVMLNNFFVGDDFTWLRWVADCKKVLYVSGTINCEPSKITLLHYFTNANGFFYRPGMKLYFYAMYAMFWLNPLSYHIVSILLHFVASAIVFLIGLRILKSKLFASIASLLFLLLSVHAETIFWISSVGHLFSSVFILLTLLFFILWKETRKIFYIILSLIIAILAPMFHELGIIAPFIIIFYDVINGKAEIKKMFLKWYFAFYALLILLYLFVRGIASSHWSGGDYTYNMMKLPLNVAGNIFGYIALTLFGTSSLPVYQQIRTIGKIHIGEAAGILFFLLALFVLGFVFLLKNRKEIRMWLMVLMFFCIPLLPFLPLGNIAPRYVYLSSFGLILFVVFLLQKLYGFVSKINKYVAYIIVLLLVFLISFINVSRLQQENTDWHVAGEITNNTLVSLNSVFSKTPLLPNPVFYFVNIPIRYKEAWVFPVGLPDALWFTFQNQNLTVHTDKSLDVAFDAAEGSASAKVFEFSKDNSLEEIARTKTTVTVHAK